MLFVLEFDDVVGWMITFVDVTNISHLYQHLIFVLISVLVDVYEFEVMITAMDVATENVTWFLFPDSFIQQRVTSIDASTPALLDKAKLVDVWCVVRE